MPPVPPSARFSPPPVELPSHLEWVIRRALGPPRRAELPVGEPALAFTTANELLLTSRIARRTPGRLLGDELGEQLAESFAVELRNCAMIQLQYRETCRCVAELAGGLNEPAIFLKGMALVLANLSPPGDRPVADVDVLVSAGSAWRLQSALIESGFRHTADVVMRHPHHLPPLRGPHGVVVEVHDRMAGARLRRGAPSASAEELLRGDLCLSVAGLPGAARVPRLDLLVAHMVAHVLAHHPATGAYFFRLVVDLQNLLDGGRVASDLAAAASRWVDWLVDPAEIEALFWLAKTLAAGASPGTTLNDRAAGGTLLRHFTAVTIDRRYRRSHALRSLLLRDDPGDLSRGRTLLPRLWWRRSEVLAPDGKPLSRLRFLLWTGGRPGRFLLRLAEHACSLRRDG